MKRPAFQWYPGDARRDVALQACSLEARGLWREMMDLMHDGTPYGHLTAGDVPMNDEQLGRIVGIPAARARKLLTELETHRVFSRNDDGVIFSRRMVRDEHIRTVRATCGKLGGNPALVDNPEVKVLVKQTSKQTRKQKPTPAVAVAVAVAKEQQTSASGEAVDRFDFAPFAKAWFSRYDGPIAAEPNCAPLKWLVTRHGMAETLRRWVIYLDRTEAQYAVASKLKSGWGQYGGLPTPGSTIVITSRGRTLLELFKRYDLFSYSGDHATYEPKIAAAASDPLAGPDFRAECRLVKPWKGIDAPSEFLKVREIDARLATKAAVPA